MKKIFSLILIYVFIGSTLFTLSAQLPIYISELNINFENKIITSEELSLLLKDELSRNDKDIPYKHLLRNFGWKIDNWYIKNNLGAHEVCDVLDIEYILYGFVTIEDNRCLGEIRLYSKTEGRSIFEINYQGAELTINNHVIALANQINSKSEQIQEILRELALKNNMEISKPEPEPEPQPTPEPVPELNPVLVEVSPEVTQKPFVLSNYIGIYEAAGYYVPMGAYWDIFTGLLTLETGVQAVRLPHFITTPDEIFKLRLRPGLMVAYSLGMNKPGYNRYYYHGITVKIPLELCFEFSERFIFTVGTGPQLQIDIFSYTNENGTLDTLPSTTFSLFALTGFEYLFGKNRLIGIGNNHVFDFTFYQIFFPVYKVQLYVIYRFKER